MRFSFSQVKKIVFDKFFCKCTVANIQTDLFERMSHELRTLLTGIVGYSEFLGVNSTEPMISFTAKIIRESSLGLERASKAFFDLHRLNIGKIVIFCSRFSLSDLVDRVVKSHQKLAFERDVKLISTCSAEARQLTMKADARLVYQVVDSLIYCVIQSAEKKQSIHLDLSFDKEGDWINLMLIFSKSNSNQAHIRLFDDFWNYSEYNFRLQEGPGVELALVKSLIPHLKGCADFKCLPNKPPQLVVRLPLSYGRSKVH